MDLIIINAEYLRNIS